MPLVNMQRRFHRQKLQLLQYRRNCTRDVATASFNPAFTTILLLVVLSILIPHSVFIGGVEYRSFDGLYNNVQYPELGAEHDIFFRLAGKTSYRDHTQTAVSAPFVPSSRLVSNILFHQPDIPVGISPDVPDAEKKTSKSMRNNTALMVFFGQQVVTELVDGMQQACPVEYFNIPVPKCDPFFDSKCEGHKAIPLTRSRYQIGTGDRGPSVARAHTSAGTAWIDGNSIYGTSKAWSDKIREGKGGRLKSLNGEGKFPASNSWELPFVNQPPPALNPGPGKLKHVHTEPVSRLMATGSPGGFENPALASVQLLWWRNHNWHANRLYNQHVLRTAEGSDARAQAEQEWTDERLFQEARKYNVAEYQRIVYYEWFPAFTGRPLEPYTRYNPTISPAPSHLFQTSAMRFGHTLVPPALFRRDAKCNVRREDGAFGRPGSHALRTCNVLEKGNEVLLNVNSSFKYPTSDPADPLEYGHGVRDPLDEMLMGLSSQYAEREDIHIVEDLRNFVLGNIDFNRRDLPAINIQRARDHGVPDYNTVRESLGLGRIQSFDEIAPHDPELARKIAEAYQNDTSKIDLFAGGLAETSPEGNPGPTFSAIVRDHFRRIRDGDRFYFENYNENGLFNTSEFERINRTTIREIILRNTNIPPEALQRNLFFLHVDDPTTDDPAPCRPPENLGMRALDNCTALATFDYWDATPKETVPLFVACFVSFLVLVLLGIGVTIYMHKRRRRQVQKEMDEFGGLEYLNGKMGMTKKFDGRIQAPPSRIIQPFHPPNREVSMSRREKKEEGHTHEAKIVRPVTEQSEKVGTASHRDHEHNKYGAIFYAPHIGTIPIHAEVTPSSPKSVTSPDSKGTNDANKKDDRTHHTRDGSTQSESFSSSSSSSSTPPPTSSPLRTTSSQREHAGSGWLTLRSAVTASGHASTNGNNETIFNVPLSFIRSVVIFRPAHRRHVRVHMMDASGTAAAATRSRNAASSPITSHSQASHLHPPAPLAITTTPAPNPPGQAEVPTSAAMMAMCSPSSAAFSCSAMTRLTEEWRVGAGAGAGADYPNMRSNMGLGLGSGSYNARPPRRTAVPSQSQQPSESQQPGDSSPETVGASIVPSSSSPPVPPLAPRGSMMNLPIPSPMVPASTPTPVPTPTPTPASIPSSIRHTTPLPISEVETELDPNDPFAALRSRSILLRVPKRYDVWLVFPDLASRASFVFELQHAAREFVGSAPFHRDRHGGHGHKMMRLKQAVWSPALMGRGAEAATHATRLRTMELQRFFAQLIARSMDIKRMMMTASTMRPARGSNVHEGGSIPPQVQLQIHRTPSVQVSYMGSPAQLAAPSDAQSSDPPVTSNLFSSSSSLASNEQQQQQQPSPPVGSGSSSGSESSGASGAGSVAVNVNVHAALTSPSPLIGHTTPRLPMDPRSGVAGLDSLLEMEVDRTEFARALDLDPEHPFVNHVFEVADFEKVSMVSFRRLEHVLVTLIRMRHDHGHDDSGPNLESQAEMELKVRLLFDLYDTDGCGLLELESLATMVRESVFSGSMSFSSSSSAAAEGSGSTHHQQEEMDLDPDATLELHVSSIVASMYSEVGLTIGEPVDFDTFRKMMMTTLVSVPAASADESHRLDVDATEGEADEIQQQQQQPAISPPRRSVLHQVLHPTIDSTKLTNEPGQGSKSKKKKKNKMKHKKNNKSSDGTVDGHEAAEPHFEHEQKRAEKGDEEKEGMRNRKRNKNNNKMFEKMEPSYSEWESQRLPRLDAHMVMAATAKATCAHSTAPDDHHSPTPMPLLASSTSKRSWIMQLRSYWTTYRSHLFILLLFYLITLGIFFERFWVFAYQSEQSGLRRITGWSVPITRGCASSIAFTMSVILLTACKNLISYLQMTRSARFIPYESVMSFHILVAYTCLTFVVGHVVGHMFNWYSISTQPPPDLKCYLPDIFIPSHFLPTFSWWIFGNPTNFVGVLLVVCFTIFFLVAWARDWMYSSFLKVHSLFAILYVLVILHGMNQIFAYPVTWPFLLGPATLLIVDRMWTFARVNAPLRVKRAQVLPGKVLKLTIERPMHLMYSSGQYVRLCHEALSRGEYHPFSLTSCANSMGGSSTTATGVDAYHHQKDEGDLEVHVRAVGKWTWGLFKLYHPTALQPRRNSSMNAMGEDAWMEPSSSEQESKVTSKSKGTIATMPKSSSASSSSTNIINKNKVAPGFIATSRDFYLPPLLLSGPFGSGHAGWMRFRTLVLVGAGIGITPFVSILKEFMRSVVWENKERQETRRRNSSRRDGRNSGHHRSLSSATSSNPPLRLYFIWISRTHAGYGWLLDIIRDAESLDHSLATSSPSNSSSNDLDHDHVGSDSPVSYVNHLQVQLYCTSDPKKFDLRTSMSYAFDQLYDYRQQTIPGVPHANANEANSSSMVPVPSSNSELEGASVFSGLRSTIGWGRPRFDVLLSLIAARHTNQHIGVFTSGSKSLLESVQDGVDYVNSFKGVHLHHHAEQFA